MAYDYSLSTECGPERDRADTFARHFEGLAFDLATGKTSKCTVGVHADDESNWWVDVFPDNITRSNGSGLTDAIEVSELGYRLYKQLQSAPQFRFSLFGCEVTEFTSHDQLANHIAVYRDGRTEFNNNSGFDGLVLSQVIWEELGKPLAFVPFADGYRWRVYKGKGHCVVFDDTDYGHLLRKLRAEIDPKFAPPKGNS